MEPLTSTIRYLRFPYLQVTLKTIIAIAFITNAFGVENKASSDWWSLQPIEKISPPEVTHKNLVKNPIDSFIIKKLKEKFSTLNIHSIEEHNLGPTYSVMQIKIPKKKY